MLVSRRFVPPLTWWAELGASSVKKLPVKFIDEYRMSRFPPTPIFARASDPAVYAVLGVP